MKKLFLLVAGVFLIPVALSYGVDPAATLPMTMNVTVEGTDQTHILRALMGLYLGMVTFCIIAAFTPKWRRVAVIWAVFFAYSLALGRNPQPHRRRHAKPHPPVLHGGRAHRGYAWASGAHPRAAQSRSSSDDVKRAEFIVFELRTQRTLRTLP